MRRYALAGTALAAFALVLGGRTLLADKPKTDEAGDHFLHGLTSKLGLNDKQVQEVRRIHQDFQQKAAPYKERLRSMRHEEHEAMKQVLTSEQRAKLPEVLKSAWEEHWKAMESRLGLSEQQKKTN